MNKFFFAVFLIFIATFSRAQGGDCACCTEDHQAFDFWIGQWEVTDPKGQHAGNNTIEKVLDSCILKESWTSSNPNYKGTSTNFYNTATRQWEQLWIDNSGKHLKLYGNREGNRMILSSEPVRQQDGKEYINRITWTLNENGSVRQLWEVLEGDTVINTAFDGLYKRVGDK